MVLESCIMFRRVSLTFAILSAVAVGAASADPGIVFEETTVDLGRVIATGRIEHEFRFRVAGSQPVTIVDLQPGCGCLKPMLDRKTFQSGEQGAIPFSIHPTSQPAGPKKYLLTVVVRDPDPRSIRLAILADLVKEVAVEPSNLLLYLSGSTELRQTIRITDGRRETFRIRDIVSSSDRLQADVLTPTRDGELHVHQIRLTIAADYPVGTTQEIVEIQTDDPDYPAIEVPLKVVRNGRFRCFPPSVRFPTKEGNKAEAIMRVRIADDQRQNIRIDRVETDLDGLRCDWDKEAARLPEVRLTLRSDSPLSAATEVRIHLAEPAPTTLTVPIIE